MMHLNPTELHLHRTPCLTGDEFPCHEALPPEPFDPIWDAEALKVGPRLERYKQKKVLLLE